MWSCDERQEAIDAGSGVYPRCHHHEESRDIVSRPNPNWRHRFIDLVIPVMGKFARDRVFQADNTVPATLAQGWFLSQYRGARQFRGMMPAQYQGVLVTPQTILRGVLPLDYMQTMSNREDGLNLE